MVPATDVSAGSDGSSSGRQPQTASGGATSSAALSTTAGSSATPSSSAAPSSSAPPSSSATQNRAPVITALAAARPNATTLDFRFSFAASDPDGNSLTWMLDANSDGTKELDGATLPGDVAYSYPAAGLYNATLTVSDGKLSTAQTVAVNATLAVGGPLATIHTEWRVGSVWCVGYPYNPASGLGPIGATPFKHGTPAAGVLYGEAAVDAKLLGQAFTANFGAPFSPAAGAPSVDSGIVAFYGTDDGLLETFGSEGGLNTFPPSTPANPMVVTGTIPAGSAFVVLLNCGNPAGLSVDLVVS